MKSVIPALSVLSLFNLAALAALAGCGGNAEPSATTQDELIVRLPQSLATSVHVTATDTTVTIALGYLYSPPSGWTASLTGPDGAVTAPLTASGATVTATFTGLVECTPFQFQLLDGSGNATAYSGNIHTTTPGGSACPLSETRAADEGQMFEGAFHTHTNNAWCSESNWSTGLLEYPLDQPGWAYGHSAGMNTTNTGHQHYWNPGSQPLPCGEQFVEVFRSQFLWGFDASQRRRVQSAHVVAQSATANSCVSHFSNVHAWYEAQTSAEQNATSDLHNTWYGGTLLGSPFAGLLSYQGDVAPVTSNGANLTADVTSMVQQQGFVRGGFADANDGFPSDPNGLSPWYAQDNDTCLGYLTNVALEASYAPVQPDSPLNCTATVNCQAFTVTCDGAPDQFQIVGLDGQNRWVMGIYQGSGGSQLVMKGTQLFGYQMPLEVCTVAGALESCTPVIAETYTACPAVPGQGGGGTGPSPTCTTGLNCRLQ